ncbi:hypothetical protein MLD38_016414 [Melastoma candidum]|uniref:Uncharacterized protein n=1 Tax=Melastoma candidum TaxID=119954 RepID=A0ACB9RJG5_9MYRT|nr:hypothetical protein MLD38_016414 [Melastoma candidum]
MSTAAAAAVAKAAPAKKPAAGAQKKSPGHPPFAEMISDAILALKERSGSSQVAIQKFIEEKYKHLPATFRKLLLVQLKRMVASGKLIRVKHSFKLPPSSKPKPKAKESAVTVKPEARVAAAKEKKSGTAGSNKRKAAEKPAAKAKPAAAAAVATTKAARTLKKMTSPGKKVVKTKKAPVMKKVKSPMKKPTPKKAKAARRTTTK